MDAYKKAVQKIKSEQEKYKINEFYYPKIQVISGPTGPTGPQGNSIQILGVFSSIEELIRNHPTGNVGDTYLIDGELYVWSQKDGTWLDVGLIRGPQGEIGPTGPVGPIGATGPKGEVGEKGLRGEIGPMGATGPQGVPGNIGPTGPKGNDGTSVTILGYFDSYDELMAEHPEGKAGDSYLVESNLYVWSEETMSWKDVGLIRGPQGEEGPKGDIGPTGPTGERGPIGPKGDIGPQGETGPQGLPGKLDIPTVLFVATSESIQNAGKLEILPKDKLPISVKMNDTENNYYLNTINNTITILSSGVYKVNYIVHAYLLDSVSSDNIISIGLKKVGEPTLYIGSTIWANKNTANIIVGQGIVEVNSTAWIALENVGKTSFYVQSPTTADIETDSPLATPVVNIMIQKIK